MAARSPIALALLALAACALGSGGDDGEHERACSAWRRGNPRVLALFVENMYWAPLMLEGLHDSGFEVGVASYAPDNQTLCERARGCVFWARGSPPLVRYAKTLSKESTTRDLRDALAEWRPAIVLPDLSSANVLMRKVALHLRSQPDEAARVAYMALACSLPTNTGLWGVLTQKLRLMRMIEKLGVRVPWSTTANVRTRGADGKPECLRASDTSMAEAASRLPLVVKTNRDASGHGVHMCRSRDEFDVALRSVCNGKSSHTARLEQLVEGHTLEYLGSALDGVVVAGVCYVVFVTAGEVGASTTLRTVHCSEGERFFARIVGHLGFTGVAGIDLRVDARGHTYVIDPNLRMNAYSGLRGEAWTLPPRGGLVESLVRALELGSGAAALAAADKEPSGTVRLPRIRASVTISRTRPGISDPLEPWAFCPDVLLAVPWSFAAMYNNASVSLAGVRFDAAACAVRFVKAPGVSLRQRCPLCPGRCTPLSALPTSAADEAPSADESAVIDARDVHLMCAASARWLAAHRACAGSAARLGLQAQRVSGYASDRHHQAHICGRPVRGSADDGVG